MMEARPASALERFLYRQQTVRFVRHLGLHRRDDAQSTSRTQYEVPVRLSNRTRLHLSLLAVVNST